MSRPKSKKKHSVRLSVALDEREYEELDLSAAWLIRRAVSEFVARHRDGIVPDLPLRPPEPEAEVQAKTGESSGK